MQQQPLDKTTKALHLAASIMVGVVIIFCISFILRSLAKKVTRPLQQPAQDLTANTTTSLAISAHHESEPWLQSRFINGFIFIRASVISAGQVRVPAWFMLDSGTTSCLLTTDYAAQAGIEANGRTHLSSGKTTEVSTALVDGFLLFSANPDVHQPLSYLRRQTVTLLDDDSVVQSIVGGGSIIKENYGGILGLPFLMHHNILIDFDREQVLATQHSIPNLRSVRDVIPLKLSGGRPELTVEVSVDGAPAGKWILDLGSDSSIITQETAKRLGIKAGAPFQQLSLSDASITSGSAFVRIGLGPASTRRRLQIDIPQAPIQALLNHGGDLATDYLRVLGSIGISVKEQQLYIL